MVQVMQLVQPRDFKTMFKQLSTKYYYLLNNLAMMAIALDDEEQQKIVKNVFDCITF